MINPDNSLSDAEIERLLFDAMRLTGEIPPSSIEEIARLEVELEEYDVSIPWSFDMIVERAKRHKA
jgi:hypothetical protein